MNNIKTASLLNKEGGAVLLEGIRISGDVNGLFFDARVFQSYKNDTESSIEAIYNFPLPFGSVLLGVGVILGDVSLKGQVVDKSKALDSYEDLVSSGDSAILIERTSDHNYCMNLGNLTSGETCVIELRYAQILRYEQGNLRLQIPTALAPRYGEAIGDGQFEPHQEYRNDLTASYSFELSLRLYGQLIKARISSPSHAISLMHRSKNEISNSDAYLEIGLGRSYELDRDFVLSIDEIKQESLYVQAPDYVKEDQNVALVSFSIETNTYENEKLDPPLSIKILVDCSGSMAGDSIDSVGDALEFILDEFELRDRFSLSKFGGKVEHRSRGLWQVGEASLNAAHRWVRSLHADMGGTELGRALDSTIRQGGHSPSDIFLITDGEIHAIDYVIETALSSKQRIFVVGIGSSPVESHLRRLAIATSGACEFIAPGEDVKPAIFRMFNRIRHPVYENLRVVWPEGTDIQYQTKINPTVCNGDAVNVFGWMSDAVNGDVALVGTRKGSTGEEVLSKVRVSGIEGSDAISRIGAYERIKSESIERLELALAYQLIADETSMLLEHIRPAGQKQNDIPSLHKIAQMVPAGWGGAGSVKDEVRYMRMPRDSGILFSKKDSGETLTTQEIKKLTKQIKDGLEIRKKERLSSGVQEHQKSNLLKDFLDAYELEENKKLELRKKSQTKLNARGPKRKIKMTDRENPLLWSKADELYGLTPLGLSEWLVVNDGLYLPDGFELLELISVPCEVIDWLDLQFLNEDGDLVSEEIVLGMFIDVMGNYKTLDYLNGVISSEDWEIEVSSHLMCMDGNSDSLELTKNMIDTAVQHLKEMSANSWPKAIFLLQDRS